MKCIGFQEIPDLKTNYPLFFQENYAAFEKINGWNVQVFTDGNTYISVKFKEGYFFKYGQYLYHPISKGERLSVEEELIFLKEFVEYCSKERLCDFITPPLHFSVFQNVPHESYFTDLGVITIDLKISEDELFKSFNSSYRNEISKARRDGLEVIFGKNYFEIFFLLYQETLVKQGAYVNQKHELKQLMEFLGDERSCIVVVKKGEEIYGATLLLFDSKHCYYFYSGKMENCPYPGANKLMHFEIMKWLKSKGIERYVLGGYRLGDIKGTKYDGIQKFKMRFGAQVYIGFHFYTPITWRYFLYKGLVGIYLKLRGLSPDMTGLNFRYK